MVLNRRAIRTGRLIADACALATAFWLAFQIRFEGAVPDLFAEVMWIYLPFVVAAQLVIVAAAGQHKATWRYTNLRDAVRLASALALSTLLLLVWLRVDRHFVSLPEGHVLPTGVVLLDLVLSLLGLLGVRAVTRMVSESRERRLAAVTGGVPVPTLLIGAGSAGAMVAREIGARPGSGLQIVGFLDENEHLAGMTVAGYPVLGATRALGGIVRRWGVQQVIITIASASGDSIRRIVRHCRACNLPTKIIPPLHEIVAGRFHLSKIHEVSIDDLLRRSPVRLESGDVDNVVRDRKVLVTGAGGSIGSELCRMIARLRPARLVLVDQAENSLFHIHSELLDRHPGAPLVPCLADIGDENRMDAIFAEHRPQLVFHAAAHKHVPMMEWNAGEAVKNNVLGTRIVATLADAWEAERFVMISTDKAVNPTSLMGASKRVAELFIQALAQKSSTRFMTVRFGNVLGSAGSVIPTFQRQIARGGPVTVTHPDMKRYFMTIPEACDLVLRAAALGKGGELFILDMGEPIKILDLARDLIRLSGLVPERDIQIRFTGLRPGEKLEEELSLDEEDATTTSHPRIFVGKVKAPSLLATNRLIDELGELAATANTPRIVAKFKEIVPEYRGLRQTEIRSQKSEVRGQIV
jgi:FlaA1/EpsC-like NDP-sugar epimerase